MKRFATGLAALAAVCFATSAQAGEPDEYANVNLDYHEALNTFSCAAYTPPGDFECADVQPNNTTGGGSSIMVLLTGVPQSTPEEQHGVGAVQFGIDYSNSTNADWSIESSCGLAIPSPGWPDSGTGIAIAYGVCLAPVGPAGIVPVALLVNFAPATGTMSFIPNSATGELNLVQCTDATRPINQPGSEVNGIWGFGGTGGSSSCMEPIPTSEHTWGQIKSMF